MFTRLLARQFAQELRSAEIDQVSGGDDMATEAWQIAMIGELTRNAEGTAIDEGAILHH